MSMNKKKFKVNITITGDGQEFVQGIIDNKTYQQIKDKAHNDCKSIEATWQEETGFFAEKTLDLEDWYEYNEKAHKWGTFLENTQVSIEIDGKNIIENKLIFDDVKYTGNPDDKFTDIGDLNGLCTKDDQNGCLITTIVHETGFFSTLDFEIDSQWDWKKLKFLMFSTDSVGLGEDYGDIILGISYNEENFWCDFSSSGGEMTTYMDYLDNKKIEKFY